MCVDMFVAMCTDMAFTQELAGDAAVAGFDVDVQVRVILGARAPHGTSDAPRPTALSGHFGCKRCTVIAYEL